MAAPMAKRCTRSSCTFFSKYIECSLAPVSDMETGMFIGRNMRLSRGWSSSARMTCRFLTEGRTPTCGLGGRSASPAAVTSVSPVTAAGGGPGMLLHKLGSQAQTAVPHHFISLTKTRTISSFTRFKATRSCLCLLEVPVLDSECSSQRLIRHQLCVNNDIYVRTQSSQAKMTAAVDKVALLSCVQIERQQYMSTSPEDNKYREQLSEKCTQDTQSETEKRTVLEGHVKSQRWKAIMTVPNLLTTMRIALTPYLGYLVLLEEYTVACGLFFFAGLTDLLDGWIARRFPSQSSAFGSFLDPLADKLLISTLFISLTLVNLIPLPLAGLVVVRDVSLIAAAFYVRYISLPHPVRLSAFFNISIETAELKPMLISKINTTVQLGLVVASLAAPVLNYVDHAALHALWYLTAGTTLWSGIGYIFAKDTFRIFKKERKHQ